MAAVEITPFQPQQPSSNGHGEIKSLSVARPLVVKSAEIQKFVGGKLGGGEPGHEIGTTGLRQYGGFVLEEWLNTLQGRRAAWAYREMMDNDPVVGAILFAIEMLARGVNWRAEGDDAQRTEFLEQNMHDMSHTWLDFISEALSMLPYGWSFHEIVYKRRMGRQSMRLVPTEADVQGEESGLDTDRQEILDTPSSEFKDGKIGWRKMPARAQETLLRWGFKGYGTPIYMEQIDWHGGHHVIPIEKGLLLRTKATRGNPEGRSILRNAWTAFYRMSNIQQIEAIGIERDLAGIPVITPPENVDLNSQGQAQLRQYVEDLVASIRKDEQQGIVMPQAGWELELLTTGGSRQVDTNEVIRRYEQRIASSMLADFVLLGQDALGSYAMVDIKAQLFGVAVDTVLDIICKTLNEHAVPRLLALNGMSVENPPRITHSSAGRIDLEKVGRFLQSIALAGGPIPWSRELLEELFKEAGLPAKFEGGLATEQNPSGNVTPQLASGAAAGPRNDGRERQTTGSGRATTKPNTRPTMTKAETKKGAMVALYPDKDCAEALAVAGGEPAEELHVTLAYFGKAKNLSPADIQQIMTIAAGFAASCPKLEGDVNGLVCFEGSEPCCGASVDVPHLAKKQGRLMSMLSNGGVPAKTKHGFQPHLTLAYGKDVAPPPTIPVTFKTVSCVVGGERTDYELRGDPSALSKSEDA